MTEDKKDKKLPKRAETYEEIRMINVSDKIEKKMNLNYLSWAWALDTLLLHDPNASWNYPDPKTFPDGTMMVFCDVTAFGKTRRGYLPVIDHKNQPIKNPNAFQYNTSLQRCLAKAIALHGLGLYIYAGEDLPVDPDVPVEKDKKDDGIGAPGCKRTGNKAIDGWLNQQIGLLSNAPTIEDLRDVYPVIIKQARANGCTEDQIALLTDQKDNRKEFLAAKVTP